MSFNLTNLVVSPALRSQDAIVTISWTASNTSLKNVFVGQKCGVVGGGKLGTVSEIDPNGLFIKCKPASPDARFDSSSTPGQLAVNELITFF
jgi:hypothetical protein